MTSVTIMSVTDEGSDISSDRWFGGCIHNSVRTIFKICTNYSIPSIPGYVLSRARYIHLEERMAAALYLMIRNYSERFHRVQYIFRPVVRGWRLQPRTTCSPNVAWVRLLLRVYQGTHSLGRYVPGFLGVHPLKNVGDVPDIPFRPLVRGLHALRGSTCSPNSWCVRRVIRPTISGFSHVRQVFTRVAWYFRLYKSSTATFDVVHFGRYCRSGRCGREPRHIF